MDFTEMLDRATENTGLDQAQAERALPAFLETLALRLAGDEQHDLAAQLPEELQRTMQSNDPDAQALAPDEFVRQFARRADLSQDTARGAVHGLWDTVAEAVSIGEADEVITQLPAELAQLFTRG